MKPTIIDFGLAFNMKMDKGFNKCGTAAYMAPQVFNCTQLDNIPYCTKVDLFGLGVIAHIMMLGFNPIKVNSNNPAI